MRFQCALICAWLGWLPAVWGADPAAPTGVVRDLARDDIATPPAGDVTNITEYLQEKFRLPPPPVPAAPPGPNDLATTDGQIYRNVRVWKTEPDGLTLRHDEGLTKLEFPQLPEEWRRKYEYDPERAAAYRRAVAAAFEEAERNQRILRAQIHADRADPRQADSP